MIIRDPMCGHPGYQGDDLDWVASIVKKVGSPRLKLLFDIYHVQIMHGDVIRRMEENNLTKTRKSTNPQSFGSGWK